MDIDLTERQIAILLHFGLQGLQTAADGSEIDPKHLEPFVLLSLEFMPTVQELHEEDAPEPGSPLTSHAPEGEKKDGRPGLELVRTSDPPAA